VHLAHRNLPQSVLIARITAGQTRVAPRVPLGFVSADCVEGAAAAWANPATHANATNQMQQTLMSYHNTGFAQQNVIAPFANRA
jgi:hypothetical protein